MSSAPNRPTIKEILEAQYEADLCSPSEQAIKTKIYLDLLDRAIEGKPYSRLMLAEALKDRYKDFRRARKKQENLPPKVENQLTEEESY
ncbi:MAG TPA: hypothetical protein VL981_05495 [Candidatus Methylacidiphilales bacterium]|nr:hypothetical protein [Candidatus Methylacidiphilales bacterium]